jgi:O-antigen ligase
MGLPMFFAALYVIAAAVSLWSRVQVVGFVNETPGIRSTSDLDRFKELARMEMYLALFMIVLLVTGLITGMVLILRYGMTGLLAVLVANAVVLGLGLYHKGAEEKARSLRAAEGLEAEYRRVGHVWNKKALPDF